MENRYLYKAKRIDNGEWVQGYLYGIWEKRYILWGMTNDIPNMIEVDLSTICQCTGLEDKNGKLIWENDIVMEESNTAPIKFGMYGSHFDYGINNLGFYVNFAMDTYLRQDIGYWHKKVEVIGNIFDNPELFEGKNHDD